MDLPDDLKEMLATVIGQMTESASLKKAAQEHIAKAVLEWHSHEVMTSAMMAHWLARFGHVFGIADSEALTKRDVALFEAGMLMSDLVYQSLPSLSPAKALEVLKHARVELSKALTAMELARAAREMMDEISTAEPPDPEVVDAIGDIMNMVEQNIRVKS